MNTLIASCIVVLAFLLIALGIRVSLLRGNTGSIFYGAENDPESALTKSVRAHGNAAEFSGALIGLFLLAGLSYTDDELGILVPALIVAITVGRYLGAVGFLTCKTLARMHPLKIISAAATYFGGAALCVCLLLHLVF